MDLGWTIDSDGLDDQVISINVRRFWRFCFGTCHYACVPQLPGLWFFNVEGVGLRLHGKW